MAEPKNVTFSSLLMQMPESLFGLDMSDPAGAQLGQYILQFVKNQIIEPMTGIKATDPIWNATLYSNMSNFGIMMQNMNMEANSRGLSNMQQLQASARYQFFEGWQRTATPRDVFERMTTAERGGFSDYNAFIESKTQGMMDNTILNLAMTSGLWDPTGKMMASYNIKEASANVARDAMWRGDDQFSKKADAVARIFMNDKLELDYNKRDYGMMTMNETSALLANLTKNMSFAPGAKSDAEIKTATEELRNRLKSLSEAMSPLKDFFGDDVPKMIQFLEDLTGKSLNQLDSGTISSLSKRVMNSIATGSYTANEIQKLTTQMDQTISRMDVPFYLDNAALSMSDRILTAVNAGSTPSLMSDNSYRQAVSDRIIRQAASPFANNINLAFALWSQGREGNIDQLQSQFQQEWNDKMTSGDYTVESAMLAMSGMQSIYNMQQAGYGLSAYGDALKAGLGARMASTEAVRWRAEAIIGSRVTPEESKAFRDVIDMFIQPDNAERNGMSTDELYRYFNKMDPTDARAIAFNRLNQDKNFQEFMVDLHKQSVQIDADRKNRNADLIRARTAFIEKTFGQAAENPADLNDAIVGFFLGDDRKGMNWKQLENRMIEATSAKELMREANLTLEDLGSMQALMQAGELVAAGGSEEDRAMAEKRAISLVKGYALDKIQSPDRNELLQPYIRNFREASDENMGEAARVLFTVAGMNSETLRLYSRKAKEDEENGVSSASLTDRVTETLKEYDSIKKAIQSNSSEEGMARIRSGDIKVGDKALMDYILPNWREVARDEENGVAIMNNAIGSFLAGREISYVQGKLWQEDMPELQRRFGDNKEQFRQQEEKAISALKDALSGNAEYVEKKSADSAGVLTEKGTALHESYLETLRDPSKREDWIKQLKQLNLKDEQIQSIETMYDSWGNMLKSATPETMSATGLETVESLLAKALGDGGVFKELDKAVNSLTDILKSLPNIAESMKIVADKIGG